MWHIVTPEYPPSTGGVGDYTKQIAIGLRDAGDEVHVWCPFWESGDPGHPSWVHPFAGGMKRRNLRRLNEQLDSFPAPRRLLVQWVPHGYGYRSMNLPFCLWLWKRARSGDTVDLMLHEAFLKFGEGNWRQDAAAAVHRLMTLILLRAASRVAVSTPAWESLWKPYALGKRVPFTWLPIPSNIPVTARPEETALLRKRLALQGQPILGHFGTYPRAVTRMLDELLPEIFVAKDGRVLLLMGSASDAYRESLIRKYPEVAGRVLATGTVSSESISSHLAACDLLLQPFPDGITTRRCSAMAALAHGTPMVTTSGYLTESFWEDNRAVAITSAHQIDEFIRCVEQLLRDPEELERMGRAARHLYVEKFDTRHVISALRETLVEKEPCYILP
ncbi:MAG TPA: glycosyltransferase family 4 protein [Verrucomicrobiae bacterium]|nr:glycosyltransferase family 4 protein [Verrucomicrobiae bacterium]